MFTVRSALLELAQLVAKAASVAEPNQEYCTSFLIPRTYFEGEVVETPEVVWGTRHTTVCGELVRIDVNVDHGSTGTINVCQTLRSYVAPLIEVLGASFKTRLKDWEFSAVITAR
jgi:hypothetical protein